MYYLLLAGKVDMEKLVKEYRLKYSQIKTCIIMNLRRVRKLKKKQIELEMEFDYGIN